MKTKQVLMILILLSCVIGTQAFAQPTVISLIHETENNENKFWWKGSTPAFGDFDRELASSFRPFSVKFFQPKISVSRVFRTHELSHIKATTIASLFNVENVVHGRLELVAIKDVVGQKGVTANLQVSLVGINGVNTQTFSSVVYDNDPAQARIFAKRNIAVQLAGFVNWASVKKTSSDVGYAISKMEIFLENGNGVLISKLREQFKMNKAGFRPIWACESGVAFRISGVDSNAIQRIAERVKSEDIEFEIGHKDQGLFIRGKK